MKRYYADGNVVPITVGDVRSSFPHAPDVSRKRDESIYHVLHTGAINPNMRTYAQWAYEQRRIKAAEAFGRTAARLRAKRDVV